VGQLGLKNTVLDGVLISPGEWANFFGRGKTGVGENVALWCGCSMPAAEWLNSSAVVIAQLAHAADESIFCHDEWQL